MNLGEKAPEDKEEDGDVGAGDVTCSHRIVQLKAFGYSPLLKDVFG